MQKLEVIACSIAIAYGTMVVSQLLKKKKGRKKRKKRKKTVKVPSFRPYKYAGLKITHGLASSFILIPQPKNVLPETCHFQLPLLLPWSKSPASCTCSLPEHHFFYPCFLYSFCKNRTHIRSLIFSEPTKAFPPHLKGLPMSPRSFSPLCSLSLPSLSLLSNPVSYGFANPESPNHSPDNQPPCIRIVRVLVLATLCAPSLLPILSLLLTLYIWTLLGLSLSEAFSPHLT